MNTIWIIGGLVVIGILALGLHILKSRKNTPTSNYQDKEFENFLNVLENLTDNQEEDQEKDS